MMRRRIGRDKQRKTINEINMMPLIDLTFLLLITFIITMPAMEQGISVRLPQGKADVLPRKKANTVSLDAEGKIFLNNKATDLEELEQVLGLMAAEDEKTAVLVRADERLDYGKVMRVIRILYKVKITRMALVTLSD
ncbi:MAG: biopolymer transporter ExbD [Kiritimatiellae bacterium]|nr:biopolymer transporter ExbD [Kiritimatiellia bacterium]